MGGQMKKVVFQTPTCDYITPRFPLKLTTSVVGNGFLIQRNNCGELKIFKAPPNDSLATLEEIRSVNPEIDRVAKIANGEEVAK